MILLPGYLSVNRTVYSVYFTIIIKFLIIFIWGLYHIIRCIHIFVTSLSVDIKYMTEDTVCYLNFRIENTFVGEGVRCDSVTERKKILFYDWVP